MRSSFRLLSQKGKSTGFLSEQNLFKDARYIFDQLAKEYGSDQVVLYGRSLGSGIASSVAANTAPKLLNQHAVDLKTLVPNINFTTIPQASHNNLSQFDLFNEAIGEVLRD